MMKKIKKFIKTALEFILNPRLLLCFGIAWMITNGWSYIMLAVGTALDIKWMMGVAGAYIAFLYLPSPEKIVTFAIAIFLMKRLFPNDEKTLGRLKEMRATIKTKAKSYVEKKKKDREDNSDSEEK